MSAKDPAVRGKWYADRNIVLLLSFLVPFVMMTGLLILSHITPFGDNTFIVADMKRQYIDFYAYRATFGSGGNSPFYSFSASLGESTLGMFAYYLTSPLLIVFRFAPRSSYPLVISALVVLKISLCGLTMNLFLQRYCRDVRSVLFSTSYAMCPYMMGIICNLMWISAIMMAPLVIDGLERLLEGKGCGRYIAAVAFSLYLNYYITYMILLFAALRFFISLALLVRKNRGRIFLRTVLATVTACCIPAFLWIPALLELGGSTRDSISSGFAVTLKNLDVFRVLSGLFSFAIDTKEIMHGNPHIAAGVLMILLLALFFGSRHVSLREKAAAFLLFAILMVSFCTAKLDLLWHAGTEPSGYQYRYAFLFVFLLVECAVRGVMSLEKSAEGREISHPAAGKLLMVLSVLFVIMMNMLLILHHLESLGRKRILVNLFLFFGAILLIGAAYLSIRRHAAGEGNAQETGEGNAQKTGAGPAVPHTHIVRICFLLICLLQLADLEANQYEIYKVFRGSLLKNSEFQDIAARTGETVRKIKESDHSFYRIGEWEGRTENDSMLYDYYGISHYDSNTPVSVIAFLEQMGYQSNSMYVYYGSGNTKTADAALGVKYVMETRDSYVERRTVLPVAVPVAKAPNKILFHMDLRENDTQADPFAMQTGLLQFETGSEEETFLPADTGEWTLDRVVYKDGTYSPLDGTQDGSMECVVTPRIDGEVYFYLTTPDERPQNLELQVDGTSIGSFANVGNRRILHLGRFAEGESFRFKILLHDSDNLIGKIMFMSEDEEALARAGEDFRNTWGGMPETVKLSSTHLTCEVPEGTDGVLVTIPQNEGWKAVLNGKKLQQERIFGALTYLKTEGESGRLDLRYITPGFRAGCIVTLLSLIALAVLWKRFFTAEAGGNGKEIQREIS